MRCRRLVRTASNLILEDSVWVFDGSYRNWWLYPNESGEKDMNAKSWCDQDHYGSIVGDTDRDFKVVSSSRDDISSNGLVRQGYSDVCFSGSIDYRGECNGTKYSLTKEVAFDVENKITINYYN